MEAKPTVSIIINNYNYDRFLQEAIDSALNQTYPFVEVIVVDDGSTDSSREIISSYGSLIVPVLKSNGGQASSLNAGFEVSKGQIIFLLDSDDLFHQEKVKKMVDLLIQNNLVGMPVIFHNMSEAIDEEGLSEKFFDPCKILYEDWNLLSHIKGNRNFFEGEISKVCTPEQVYEKFAVKYRYIPYIGMQTSCISISRTMAERVFPLPVSKDKALGDHADTFLTKASSLAGLVYSTDLKFTQYRIHGNNWHTRKEPQEKRELINKLQDDFLNSKLQEFGLAPVLSFSRSMNAVSFYRYYFGYNSGNDLLKLALDVVKWHMDVTTFLFFVKTCIRGFYYKLATFAHNFLSQKHQPKF
ncbi:MAG: hypothetical protein DCF22_08465 [Leptolyngbya sp.]|nr:MAG: hypothetical protein DCF22_08465 [Leptolyngbya sp.]